MWHILFQVCHTPSLALKLNFALTFRFLFFTQPQLNHQLRYFPTIGIRRPMPKALLDTRNTGAV